MASNILCDIRALQFHESWSGQVAREAGPVRAAPAVQLWATAVLYIKMSLVQQRNQIFSLNAYFQFACWENC